MSVRRSLANAALTAISRVTGRQAILLPAAAGQDAILALHAPYRVTGDTLVVRLSESEAGSLEARLVAYEGHWPTRVLWNGSRIGYTGPCDLSVSLSTGEVRLGSTLWGRSDAPISDRRFCWRLRYRSATGRMRARC